MADHLPPEIRKVMEDIRQLGNPKLRDRLQTLDVMLAGMVPAKGGGVMNVESMVASKTKNPVVIFTWGTNKGELTPIEARQYALQIIEASEAAVQDAAIYRAITASGGDDATAFGMITMVRDNRRKFEEEA